MKNLKAGQVCMLAPTEVLAYQHYVNLLQFCNNSNKKTQQGFPIVVYLSSKKNCINDEVKLTKKALEKKLDKLMCEDKNQRIFWIGTHSLLFNELVKPDLVMVDEQHRFGVEQRKKLSQKDQSKTSPHYISFSATPIPRTLALSIYSSLKPHFLETLPGRKKINTRINYFEDFETNIINQIQAKVNLGQKVYVVCPRIETDQEEPNEELWSTTLTARKLGKVFGDKVLEVHGKKAEKKEILDEFKNSMEKQILVTTTVVEVGVDVGEATLMVILNSERFGLAALHQLRGRVGRNDYKDNQCILVTWKKFSRSRRLRYLCEIHSGFELAQKDLELRGSGDMYGKNQSGYDSEIEGFIGLGPEKYQQIAELVGGIDFGNLKQNGLERLERFVKKESSKVWDE
ncbi:hypothetical protein HC864_00060 [Candidatus Gracilibacteria bacterium]|nr:hypothetical protein [Candidatus Gracilibacteria bacterium]